MEWTYKRIIKACKRAGYTWFEPEEMRYFNTILEGKPIKVGSKILFITSEAHRPTAPRKYSVRSFDPLTVQVTTLVRFRAFESLDDAKQEIKRISRQHAVAELAK